MKVNLKRVIVVGALIGASVMGLWAAERTDHPQSSSLANSYYLYTARFSPSKTGVVAIPVGYVWSVETSWRGVDPHGNNLADTRVMLRLHNPNENFSAITAQMDLATAAKLHHDLGEIIIKKLQDPAFQDRPHVGSAKQGNPNRTIIGVDADGVAILKDEEPK